MTAAALFTWVQGASFYRSLHETAADLLPPGRGRRWLDVGCGPGLLARLAAARGYEVRAIDRDPAMIAAATRLAAAQGAQIDFAVSDLEREVDSGRSFDVVSASSLIVVLPDPQAGLARLTSLVQPGGRALVIEATPKMSVARALRMSIGRAAGVRASMLVVWALARSGRALPEEFFSTNSWKYTRTELLGGLAAAYLLEVER